MLMLEVFVFIRSHPQFSANLFEELERMEPYLEILEAPVGGTLGGKSGWSLVFRGKLENPDGQTVGKGDVFYHGGADRSTSLEPSVVIFFSEESMEKFLRQEPELALPIAENMRFLKRRAEEA